MTLGVQSKAGVVRRGGVREGGRGRGDMWHGFTATHLTDGVTPLRTVVPQNSVLPHRAHEGACRQ